MQINPSGGRTWKPRIIESHDKAWFRDEIHKTIREATEAGLRVNLEFSMDAGRYIALIILQDKE